jgi:hypothetical protein
MDSGLDVLTRMGAQGGVTARDFCLQLAAAAATSGALAAAYARFGRSLGNRRAFALNFLPLTIVTMFVIAVVKSSLSLSLGLVGALSIVRFRTAVRDPEELIYLFACIGLGLGFGAGQWIPTLAAFVAVLTLLIVLSLLSRRGEHGSAQWLLIQSHAALAPEPLVAAVASACARARLARFDSAPDRVEAAFDVELGGGRNAGSAALLAAVRRLDPTARCLLVDQTSRPVE